MTRRWATQTRHTLRRITASIIKQTCYELIALIFIKTGLKLSYFCQKNKKFSSAGRSVLHSLCLRWLGALLPDPNCLRWLGDPPPDPATSLSIADFWLRACMKKNLLHVTAGLHLYQLLVLDMPGTFGEEDVFIHKRCIIRPKVFHPVILIKKNYLKKSFHLHQPHFDFGRDEVFSS